MDSEPVAVLFEFPRCQTLVPVGDLTFHVLRCELAETADFCPRVDTAVVSLENVRQTMGVSRDA